MFAVQYWNGLGRGQPNSCLQFSIGMVWGGPLFESDLNKLGGGGQNETTIRVSSWAIMEVKPAALGQI